MHWSDVEAIAQALEDNHPDEEIDSLGLSDLLGLVIELLDFDDDPARGSEAMLEEIEAAWIELRGEVNE